jgi:hypothetical protein
VYRLSLAADGELAVYAPGSTNQRSICERDCQIISALDVPSGRFTVPCLIGESTPVFFLTKLCIWRGSKTMVMVHLILHGTIRNLQVKACCAGDEIAIEYFQKQPPVEADAPVIVLESAMQVRPNTHQTGSRFESRHSHTVSIATIFFFSMCSPSLSRVCLYVCVAPGGNMTQLL